MEHIIHCKLPTRRVRVHLVGLGGNGAQMAGCLARLDIAMRALGHPGGLHVTAFDADQVSEANVGRQLYGPADVGQFKSLLTIHRLNQFYALDWDALPEFYDPARHAKGFGQQADIVISCVDSARARRMLHKALFAAGAGACYWLDLGNTEATGQAVLGEACGRKLGQREEWVRLPCVTELFPQLLDEAQDAADDAPSCSVAMSLASQGLFVNDVVVRFASQLLYDLFGQGRLHRHGVLANLRSGSAAPIKVDSEVWRRFGVRRRKPAAPRAPRLSQADRD